MNSFTANAIFSKSKLLSRRIYDLNVVVIASEVLSLRDYFDFVLEEEKSQFINLLAYQVNYCKWV